MEHNPALSPLLLQTIRSAVQKDCLTQVHFTKLVYREVKFYLILFKTLYEISQKTLGVNKSLVEYTHHTIKNFEMTFSTLKNVPKI